MPAAKTPATVNTAPWSIISSRGSGGGATLSYVDPLTGKAVSHKFASAPEATAWAKANILILPPGATITAHTVTGSGDPFSPTPGAGQNQYVVRLADGTEETFRDAPSIGHWLISKIGYATADTYATYQQSGGAASNIVVHPPPGSTQKRPGAAPAGIISPYQTGGYPNQSPPAGVPAGGTADQYTLPQDLGLGGGGGGGGGGGNYPGTGPALPADASPSEVEAYIRANYGYEAWMLDNPELRDLLTRSVKEGPWDDAKFQGELAKTTWWRQNGQSVFDWNALVGSDPATAQRRVTARAGQVGDMASSAGVTFGGDRLTALATDALRYGWNDDQIKTVIANEYHYDPSGASSTGDIGAQMRDVKALASNYLLPITDDQALSFAKKMFVGELSQQGLAATFAQQAAARFPALADSIANGITPGDYFSTYAAQIGNLLEKPAQSIDFLKDPRFQKVIDFTDAKGNRRPMTLAETENYVRTLPEWDTTRNARDQAFAFTQYVGSRFGKVAQ